MPSNPEIRVSTPELEPVVPGILTILVGPTASGKSSVQDGLLARNPHMKRVVTSTTREPRLGEVTGREYHFRDRTTFDANIASGKLLEYVKYGGNLYGTEKNSIEPVFQGQDLIWIVNLGRAVDLTPCFQQVFTPDEAQTLQQHTLLLLIDIPNLEEVEKRFKARGSNDNFLKRIEEDMRILQAHGHTFPHRIINQENALDQTIAAAQALIEEKKAQIGLVQNKHTRYY